MDKLESERVLLRRAFPAWRGPVLLLLMFGIVLGLTFLFAFLVALPDWPAPFDQNPWELVATVILGLVPLGFVQVGWRLLTVWARSRLDRRARPLVSSA